MPGMHALRRVLAGHAQLAALVRADGEVDGLVAVRRAAVDGEVLAQGLC